MLHVPLKKNNYTVSTPHKHICTINMPHSVPRQQICTIIWGRGVFRKKKKVLQGYKSNRKFYRAKTRNDLYYRGEKHY